MTAALGKVLVFDLDRVGAGAFQEPHRALHVERVAVAGIGIDDEMGFDAIADQRHRLYDLVHADEADIRPPETGIGNARARHVQGLESGARGNESGERVVNAGSDQDRRVREAGSQCLFGHAFIVPDKRV